MLARSGPLLASTAPLIYALAAILAVAGVGLVVVGIRLVTATRRDHAALGPLEAMGERSWWRSDQERRAATLSSARPDGAEPLGHGSVAAGVGTDRDDEAPAAVAVGESRPEEFDVPEQTIAPVEPEQPVVPVEPVEPSVPVEPVEPSVPLEPVEPSVPVEPVEPSVPVEPDEPSVPVEPDEPSVPLEPEIVGDADSSPADSSGGSD